MYDVVVIGGGISGLFCATELHKKGLRVLVIEARDRVGGRTYTSEVLLDDGKTKRALDFGGMWMGPSQTKLMALVKEFGIRYYESFSEGKNVLNLQGKRSDYLGTIPNVSLLGLLDAHLIISRLNSLTTDIDPETPWTSPKAEEYDRQTIAEYAKTQMWTYTGWELLRLTVRQIFCAEFDEISLLFFLHYIKAAGDINSLIEIKNGAQQYLFEGGAQQISIKLAERLGQQHIKLSSPVVAIQQLEDSVEVETRGGVKYVGRRCVVAMAPILCNKISFSPPLPAERSHLHQRIPMGSVIKIHLVYSTAWWRAAGFSGQLLDDSGPLVYALDEGYPDDFTPTSNAQQTHSALVGFITGHKAIIWGSMPKEERRQKICQQLVKLFLNEEAGNLIGYAEFDWRTEEYSGGCYVGFMPPGVLSRYGDVIRKRCDKIYWTCAEISTRWTGYMEGALQSGEATALQIIEDLKVN